MQGVMQGGGLTVGMRRPVSQVFGSVAVKFAIGAVELTKRVMSILCKGLRRRAVIDSAKDDRRSGDLSERPAAYKE